MSGGDTDGKSNPSLTRPRWYLIYFLLAAFDIFSLSGSLYLHHRLMGIYNHSIAADHEWAKRFERYPHMQRLILAVDAPGNDVFASSDVEGESSRIEQALTRFKEELVAARKDLLIQPKAYQLPATQILLLLDKLKAVERGSEEIVAESTALFAHYRRGEIEMAGRRMAQMDRKFAQTILAVIGLEDKANAIQRTQLEGQIKQARQMKQFEYLIAGLIAFMVCGVAIYGHKLSRVAAAEQRALEEAKLIAERANLTRSKFFAAANHDLRQPLHAITMFLPSLSKRVTDSTCQGIISGIRRSCESMNKLLEALLDISKLDAGVVQPEVKPVSTLGMFQMLTAEFTPQAHQNGSELRVVPVDGTIHTDPTLLIRILRNLLSNAIQHTSRGRVLFGARRRGSSLRFEVWDTGVGIPLDQLERIFEEFYQVPTAQRRDDQGLGLGLAIVDRLSNLLGHPVKVKSVAGKGSMFAVEVPMIRGRGNVESEPSLTVDYVDSEMAGLVVVVIDDEVEVLEGTRIVLEDLGCQVIGATTTEAALAQIAESEREPDFILVDFRLSGGDCGIKALQRVRQFVGMPLPAVVVTGDTNRSIHELAEINDCKVVHKPVQPAELLAVLETSLRRFGLRTSQRQAS